jgi:hypothetical protein
VKSRRTVLPAVALIVTFLGVTAAPAFAGILHPICAATHHDCGNTTKIASCCCGDEFNGSAQSVPAQARTQVDSGAAVLDGPIVPSSLDPVRLNTMFRALAAPRAAPVDLPTLFACLLI